VQKTTSIEAAQAEATSFRNAWPLIAPLAPIAKYTCDFSYPQIFFGRNAGAGIRYGKAVGVRHGGAGNLNDSETRASDPGFNQDK
jgi:hypothetical protein